MNTRYTLPAAMIFLALVNSLAIAQFPEIYLSFSDFGDGNASTNTSRHVVAGNSECAYVWVDENFTIQYGACLDLDVATSGTIAIDNVTVFNPDVVVDGTTVVIGQRWQAISNGINMTADSVDNFCGVLINDGYGISPDLIPGSTGMFADTLYDPLSNAFLFVKIDFTAITSGNVTMMISEAGGGILGPPTINFGSISTTVVLTDGADDYYGLAADPLGEAILVLDEPTNELSVHNLGSSGLDGVRIQLGSSEGYEFQVETESIELMEDDFSMVLETRAPTGPPVVKRSIGRQGISSGGPPTSVALTLEEVNIPTGSVTIEARLDGEVVDSVTLAPIPGPTEVLATIDANPGATIREWRFGAIKGNSQDANHKEWIEVLSVSPVAISGNLPVFADQVFFIFPDPSLSVTSIDSIELTGTNVSEQRIQQVEPSIFGTSQTALGDAILTADNSAGTLTVSNIGSSGLDGVSTDLSDVGTAGYTFEDLDTNGPYGPGAQLSFSVRGDRDGVPDTQLGTVRFTETATGDKEITAEYPQSTTYQLVVRNNGATVASITGHTGLVATVPNWPGNCTKSVVWNDFDLDCIKTCWELPLSIDIPGQGEGPIMGDELLVLAETGTPIDSLSELQMLAVDIPTVTLSNIDAFVLGDINGDGNVNLLDVEPFIAVLSSGKFNVAADINGDGNVNLLDVDPFILVLAGG